MKDQDVCNCAGSGFLSECGGLDTALCSPALPAAFALSILVRPPSRPANTKRCQGHRTPKESVGILSLIHRTPTDHGASCQVDLPCVLQEDGRKVWDSTVTGQCVLSAGFRLLAGSREVVSVKSQRGRLQLPPRPEQEARHSRQLSVAGFFVSRMDALVDPQKPDGYSIACPNWASASIR